MTIQTNKNQDDPVTIKEWLELIEFIGNNFATKDDLNNFATKDEVGNIKEEVRQIVEKSEKRILEMRSDIFNAKDEIVREIKTMREEQIMHSGIHKIITDETEHLKKRVTRIEYCVGIEPVPA